MLQRVPWSPDPILLAGFATSALLYARAIRVLARRGFRVGRWQQAAWWAGWMIFATALMGPVDPLGEDLFTFHMAQHLLIADAGAPLLLLGLRSPVHLFVLPRRTLVLLARRRRLRAVLRFLRLPLVAIPVFVGTLYLWHWAPLFTAAVEDPAVHALQHQSFVAASILVWWSALEPHRRRMRGELWKIAHLLGSRVPGMFLGMFLVFSRAPFYDVYETTTQQHGLTPLADQQSAGGLMVSADFVLVVVVLSVFFWRAAADDVSSAADEQATTAATTAARARARGHGGGLAGRRGLGAGGSRGDQRSP